MAKTQETSRYLRRAEAARYMTVHVRTLDRLVLSGQLHPIRVSPGRLAFDATDLDNYMSAMKAT